MVAMDEAFDFGDKFFDAAEGAATDGLLRDDVEPDFHLLEPGRVGRCAVHVVAGACCQPALDARMLVGSVVINDQMHVESFRDTGVYMAQKIEELLVTMTALTLAQDRSGDGVEGREQCGSCYFSSLIRRGLLSPSIGPGPPQFQRYFSPASSCGHCREYRPRRV
jgi:hypothetical protein